MKELQKIKQSRESRYLFRANYYYYFKSLSLNIVITARIIQAL